MSEDEPTIGDNTSEYTTSFDQLVSDFFEMEPMGPVEMEFGGLTHRGNVREFNEDQFLIVQRHRQRKVLRSSLPEELFPEPQQTAYTLAVADGMGGQHFGELASLMAIRKGWDLGGAEIKWTLKMNQSEIDEMRKKSTIIFQLLHREFENKSKESPRLGGMGTTLTICYVVGNHLFVMHAGDSRAYLFRENKLSCLTHDHTISQMMIDSGDITPGSREERRYRHILTSGLGGGFSAIHVDFDYHELLDGDTLLLCSDGLTDLVSDDEIAHSLGPCPTPDICCQELVDLALERGGKDNITVVISRFHFGQFERDTGLATRVPGTTTS